MSFTSTNGPGGDETEADESVAQDRSRLEDSREAKKLKPSGNGYHTEDASDAETVPDEHVDEEDDESAEEEEEEDEDDDQEDGDETQGDNDDELEERPTRDSEDEALDEDGDSE